MLLVKLLAMQRPQTVTTAVRAIWLTIAIDAAMMLAAYDGTAANADSLTFNGIMLMLYAFVTIKIGAGRKWARLAYAILIAAELAMVAAFDLSDATELEMWVTYLTLPLEIWILYKLYCADGDAWFASVPAANS